ncbi:CpsB/CapC family capsule biosynthesis tyrosine phosphatase [Lachnospiraceae bacterium 29-84]
MIGKIGYLDLHSHILPGIDDGSVDWDMSARMIQAEYRQGVRTIVATPHNYQGKGQQDNERVRELCKKADILAGKIDRSFHVIPGNEVLYREGIPREIEEGHILTLGDSPYLLIEFIPNEGYRRIRQGLRELVEYGFCPVVAHMERVGALFGQEERIDELIDMGCYMQVNCHSLMGGLFDRRTARLKKFIESGRIHFLGSDCHNMTERPPIMLDCIRKLYKKLPKECVDRLVNDNQEQFLQKKYI